MMNTTCGAGTRRLANSYGVMIFALAAQAAGAQVVVATPVAARGRSDTISVKKLDSAAVAARARLTLAAAKRVDSLLTAQNDVSIGSPEYRRIAEEVRKTIQSMLPVEATFVNSDGNTITFSREGEFQAVRKMPPAMATRVMVDVTPRGWLGFYADGYNDRWDEMSGRLIRYYQYPTVVAIDPNSPASKVGLQLGDSLLAYDGLDLKRSVINLTRLLEPGHKVAIKLRKDGETKEIEMVVVAAPPDVMMERRATAGGLVMAQGQVVLPDSSGRREVDVARTKLYGGRGTAPVAARAGGFAATKAPTAAGILGASMTEYDSAAVVAFTQNKVTRSVVMISRVNIGTPAERMGLKAGDMILSVGDAEVFTMFDILRQVGGRGPNQSTPFIVLRAGKKEKLTYEPR